MLDELWDLGRTQGLVDGQGEVPCRGTLPTIIPKCAADNLYFDIMSIPSKN